MAKKKKLATAAVAVAASAALLLGGTFAWQSISQTALNEASDVINPGGRLHDDFYIDANGDYNADIYVENFADDEIFARVRLEEYMEVVINYGTDAAITQTLKGSQGEVDGDNPNVVNDEDGNPLYERDYALYTFDNNEVTDADGAATGDFSAAYDGETSWFNWTPGSAASETVYYMPTFNMNKDSLVADRNGMYVDRIGGISNRSMDQYEDYTVYVADQEEAGTEIYDVDGNQVDEVGFDFENLTTYVDAGNIKTVEETHNAVPVGTTNGLISMSEWINRLNNGDDTDNYWVYDTDGWVYWSSPIAAKSTTGLLLDSIELNQVMDDTWYYAINVIGQFCTAGDVDGFYNDGKAPSSDAETLLEEIGAGTGEAADDFVAQAGTVNSDGGISLYIDSPYISVNGNAITINAGAAYANEEWWYTVDTTLTDTNLLWGDLSSRIVYKLNDETGKYEEWGSFATTENGYASSGKYVPFDMDNGEGLDIYLGSEDAEPGTYKIVGSGTDEEGTAWSGEVVLTVDYVTGDEDEEPEIIDQPLDIYVSYVDGSIAGAQPTNPETGLPTEGVIQIFALGIENKDMYLGGKLTQEDGTVIDSRAEDSGMRVSYTFEDYTAVMKYTWAPDDDDTEYTFSIITVEDASSEYNGYKVAVCDQTNEWMAALNESTGHLRMLAEDQPLNQDLLVKATTTYNGTVYESNSQTLFFVNRDISLFVEGTGTPDDADSYYYEGYYTPGTETSFTVKAELLFDNEVVTDEQYPITWEVTDSDGNKVTDDSVTLEMSTDGSSRMVTVVVSESATDDHYRVIATYNHTADDGKNKGIYQTGWGIHSSGSSGDEKESTLAMTFASDPEYTEDGNGGAYIEIERDRTGDEIWNLYGCSEGEFTLSSDNASVTFEPYSEGDDNVDMNIVIPASVTEDFTVTATAMNDSGKSVVFTVKMVDDTGSEGDQDASLTTWINANPNGYVQGLSNNNVTLSLVGLYGSDYVTEELTNVVWSITSTVNSDETKITESSGTTANLFVSADETAEIEISAEFTYDGESHTATYTLENKPQVGTMTVFLDSDHSQHIGTTYTKGSTTTVVLDAQYFPLYTGTVQAYDAAYTGEYETAFADQTRFYLAISDDENSYGEETEISGVALTQDSNDKSKVTVTIDSTVTESFYVMCCLESGMLVGFSFTPA